MSPPRIEYPPARKANIVDNYHGVTIADPYRWLEDANSPETQTWVDAQNSLTRSMLTSPAGDDLVERLTTLYDFPRGSVPVKRGTRYLFSRNSGLQNQAVLYVQDGLNSAPRVLLDPNGLSADGTVALTAVEPNDDGSLIAYALSKSGSDQQEILVREVATSRDRSDRIAWVKFASIAWTKDGRGFYYTRFPPPGTVPAGDENYFNKVYYHRLGDPQSSDTLSFDRPDEREAVFEVAISHDDRWFVVTAFQGASDKSEVYVIDRQGPDAKPRPLFTGFRSAYLFVESHDGRLYFRTDDRAPLGRIIAVDPTADPPQTAEVVSEQRDTLSSVVLVHGTLVASYLHNASDQIRLFDPAGSPIGEIPLPGIGSVSELSGRPDDDELFLGFTSFTSPPASFRFRFATRTTVEFWRTELRFDPAAYETRQVWYPSKDGTNISMFLVHRKGMQQDGSHPVLLTGYGGFNTSLTPAFDPLIFPLLDRGGIYAVANLRGGGEYGESWHEAGMFERKQNVFDDFIAAAEWLVANRLTARRRLAIEGGSNGGLLTAAVMVQRPDLFGSVICRVPVADMLRYHLFTVGRFWISEYGSADDPKQFPYLLKYSPYHHVKDGVAYPPILITTADTDDRVSPGMAKKFAARLQAADGAPAPVLIRVETKAGHGAGKPVSKQIEEDADVLAFLSKYLDMPAAR
jgi:prolyl oligopeptidase